MGVPTKWLMFRARRKEDGNWAYGCPVPIGNRYGKINFDVWGIVEYGHWHNDEPIEIEFKSLQKFTGRQDNNGHFIFQDLNDNYVFTTAMTKELFPTMIETESRT